MICKCTYVVHFVQVLAIVLNFNISLCKCPSKLIDMSHCTCVGSLFRRLLCGVSTDVLYVQHDYSVSFTAPMPKSPGGLVVRASD